jgi:hypothetical protein
MQYNLDQAGKYLFFAGSNTEYCAYSNQGREYEALTADSHQRKRRQDINYFNATDYFIIDLDQY